MIRKLMLFTLIGLSVSCSKSEDILEKVFDNNQAITVNSIIDFYDNFVLSCIDKNLSIDKAYLIFLKKNCHIALENGTLDGIVPDIEERINFYKTLDRNTLPEIYYILDSVRVYDENKRELVNIYQPYAFSLNTQGKFMDLLQLLADKNDFYQEYYDSAINCGTICASHYSAVLKQSENMDFSKKEERLVFIVTLLHGQ